MDTASALAHPNIAFIKYWGNRDDALCLPENGSISMNLASLQIHTRVTFDPSLGQDSFNLNNIHQIGASLDRVSQFLDLVREKAGVSTFARVESASNFPAGAGMASSAAAFAALALASTAALGLEMDERQLSMLARRGSGSASRSIPEGFVEWLPGDADSNSYAFSLAPVSHWDLVDCIAVLEDTHKTVTSSKGHLRAKSSPLQAARVAGAPQRLDRCREAIANRDFDELAVVAELDSNLMHAVMMTSAPPLFYWAPASIEVMKSVMQWRESGLPACYTLDAGPNVHVICRHEYAEEICTRLRTIAGVKNVLASGPGGGAHLTTDN
jgi:diphosphomevalonate decarboxylase